MLVPPILRCYTMLAWGGRPTPSTLPSPIHPLWGAPLLCRVLLRIFVLGAAPHSYANPLSLYLPLFVDVRGMSDLYHWPCKGQTLLSLLLHNPV